MTAWAYSEWLFKRSQAFSSDLGFDRDIEGIDQAKAPPHLRRCVLLRRISHWQRLTHVERQAPRQTKLETDCEPVLESLGHVPDAVLL